MLLIIECNPALLAFVTLNILMTGVINSVSPVYTIVLLAQMPLHA